MRTVFEVGMNQGTDTPGYLTQSDMVLYGFEPTIELVKTLNEKFGWDERVKIVPLAVDVENRFTTFNVAGWQDWGCSSLNEFTDGVKERWNGFDFHFTGKQSVMTIRLDNFIEMHGITNIDYLHVDAQGSDFNVLKSLGRYIDIVQAGQVEVSYNVPLYKGVDNSYDSVSKWLTEMGFVYDVEYDHPEFKTEANIKFRRPQ
jgi:FkbM family methyltransferase